MNRKTLFALLTSFALILALVSPAAAQDDAGTIMDVAAGNEDFSTLVAALQAAGLADRLNSEGEFTVFAPTNAAFESMSEGTLESLLADPAGDLTQILLYHVVPGRAMAADLSDGMNLTTLQGNDLSITTSGDTLIVNDADIVTTDIEAANGIIHVIDTVIMPPAAQTAQEDAGDEDTGDDAADDAAQDSNEQDGNEQDGDEEDMTAEDAAGDDGETAAQPEAEEDMAAQDAAAEDMDGDDGAGDDMAGGETADDASKGGPATMPTTGGNFGSSPLFIIIAGAVVAGLAGSTWWSRRRR